MNPTNPRHTQRLQAKRTATPTPKCDAKPSTEEYEQLRLLLPQCCLLSQLLFPLILSLRLLSPRARTCQQKCRQSGREKMELRSVIYGWAIWCSIYTTAAALLPVPLSVET